MVRTTPFSRIIGGEPSPNDLNRTLADVLQPLYTRGYCFEHQQASRHRGSRCIARARRGRRRRCVDGRSAGRDHGPGDVGRACNGDADGDGEPERPGDDLVLRVRHDHELRHANGERQRRLRHGQHGRVGVRLRPHAWRDLPLPSGRDEQRRHRPRRRRDLHHACTARRGHEPGDERCAHVGDAQRLRRPERPGDDVVLRVRDEHELRLEDRGEERRRRLEHGQRVRVGHGPRARTPLPLPPRRDERCRDEPRRRSDLHDVVGAHRGDRIGELDRADLGAGSTAPSSRTARRRRGTSSTGRARATARRPRRGAPARERARRTSLRRSRA